MVVSLSLSLALSHSIDSWWLTFHTWLLSLLWACPWLLGGGVECSLMRLSLSTLAPPGNRITSLSLRVLSRVCSLVCCARSRSVSLCVSVRDLNVCGWWYMMMVVAVVPCFSLSARWRLGAFLSKQLSLSVINTCETHNTLVLTTWLQFSIYINVCVSPLVAGSRGKQTFNGMGTGDNLLHCMVSTLYQYVYR